MAVDTILRKTAKQNQNWRVSNVFIYKAAMSNTQTHTDVGKVRSGLKQQNNEKHC
jgi:hypothetical protein